MNSHPLQFFKDLIENPLVINQLQNEFFKETEYQYDDGEIFSMALEENRDEGYYIIDHSFFEIGTSGETKIYFKDRLGLLCQKERLSFFNSIDTYLLHEKEVKVSNEYLQKIFFEVNYLISVCEDQKQLDKYPVILEAVNSIKSQLQSKYNLAEHVVIPSNKKVNTPKIQWMGRTNVLTTLFYDLIYEDKKKGITPIIKATSKEIEDFILNNFVDSNGLPFERNTINTNLKPSKQNAKRAKGEISIEITRE